MTKPMTEAGWALGARLRETSTPGEMGRVIRDAILAIEAEARADALREAADRVATAFEEYIWGLSISPQPASGPCEESVRYFRDNLLAALASEDRP